MFLNYTIKINNEIDIFAKSEPKAKVIGVTGTNGKSTTSALLGHMIRFHGHKVEVGGNIGKAATSLVDPGVRGYIVLELSSFQLSHSQFIKPDYAILLNITNDHLDWHGSMLNYKNSKLKIFDLQDKKQFSLINSFQYA